MRLGALPAVLAMALAGCSTAANPAPGDAGVAFKVAFVYPGAAADGLAPPVAQGQDEAAKALADVEFASVENVAPEALGDVVDQRAKEGVCLVFVAGGGLAGATEQAAKEHAEVRFEVLDGQALASNVSTFEGRAYQAWFLAGLVAGKATRSGKAGFVAPFAIPEVVRSLNAFAIGVRQSNATAAVQVEWSKTWNEPGLEGAAAQKLIDGGCDVVTQFAGGAAAVEKAKSAHVFAIAHDADQAAEAPATVLTSTVWHLGRFFADRINAAKSGTWTSRASGGVPAGIVGLGAYGDGVTQEAKDLVEDRRKRIAEGTLEVFQGPLEKQDGSAWVAEGARLSEADLAAMMDLVEGVVGSIPP